LRSLPRFFAPLIGAAFLVLAGASSALAAASPSSASLDANWCYISGPATYCYDIDGTVRYLETTAGSSVTIHKTVRTTVYESGVYAGEIMSVQTLRGVFEADGTIVTQSIITTRSTAGDEPCAYRMVLRLVDFEAVVYQVIQTCTA
jgi:hypothetical protein